YGGGKVVVVSRLGEEEHVARSGEDGGEGKPPALAGGEARGALAVPRGGEAEGVQDLAQARLGAVAAQALVLGEQGGVAPLGLRGAGGDAPLGGAQGGLDGAQLREVRRGGLPHRLVARRPPRLRQAGDAEGR